MAVSPDLLGNNHGGKRTPRPGKTLGRPKLKDRCACGAYSKHTAQVMRHKCKTEETGK